MPKQFPPPDPPPLPEGKEPARRRKGIGIDKTDPRSHKYKAKGGPIERRYVEPEIGG